MQLRCMVTRSIPDQGLIVVYNGKEMPLNELFLQFLNKDIVISIYSLEEK